LGEGIGNKAETQYHHQAKEKPNANKDGHNKSEILIIGR
jgi:hypothetical protein